MKPYYKNTMVTLYHGVADEIAPMIDKQTINAIITDPPYGLSIPDAKHHGMMNKGSRNLDFFKNDSIDDGLVHVETIFNATRTLKPNGCVYAWLGHHQFAKAVIRFHENGWNTRFLVWNRECPVPSAPWSGWPSGASLCLFAFKTKKWTASPKKNPRSNVLTCDNYRHGIKGKVNHPTQMNPYLVREPIRVSTEQNDVVLDLFAGSGTTLVACQEMNRHAIGIEIEEKYCEIAARRLESLTPSMFNQLDE